MCTVKELNQLLQSNLNAFARTTSTIEKKSVIKRVGNQRYRYLFARLTHMHAYGARLHSNPLRYLGRDQFG